MTGWIDVDFRPAPAGWRVVYNGTEVVPLAGWLIQERNYDDGEADRRIVAAVMEGQYVRIADECAGEPEVRVIGPGEPDPKTGTAS